MAKPTFQPVSNISSSIRLAFDGRIELAFGGKLSVGPAYLQLSYGREVP